MANRILCIFSKFITSCNELHRTMSKKIVKSLIKLLISTACIILIMAFSYVFRLYRVLRNEEIAKLTSPSTISCDYDFMDGVVSVPVEIGTDTLKAVLDNHCQCRAGEDFLKRKAIPLNFSFYSRDLGGHKHRREYYLLNNVKFANSVSNIIFKSDESTMNENILGVNFISNYTWLFYSDSLTAKVSPNISMLGVNIDDYITVPNGLRDNGITLSFADGIDDSFTFDMGCGDQMLISEKLFSIFAKQFPYESYRYLAQDYSISRGYVFNNIECKFQDYSFTCSRIVYDTSAPESNVIGVSFFFNRHFILDFPSGNILFDTAAIKSQIFNRNEMTDEYGVKFGKRNGKSVVVLIKEGSDADIDGVKLGDTSI